MLTIVNAYYRNPGMLVEHYRRFRALPDDIKAAIEYVVTDDASPEDESAWGEDIGMPLQVFRCTSGDIPWNYAFARNVGCKHASNPYLLVTDIDHVATEDVLWPILDGLRRGELFDGPKDRARVYQFTHRIAWGHEKVEDGGKYKPHPDTYLLTKHFWCDVLRYHDERFRGGYGGDYDHKMRVKNRAKIEHLNLGLHLISRSVIPTASTSTLTRKGKTPAENDAHRNRVKKIRSQLEASNTLDGCPNGEHAFLSEYERVWP